MTRLREILTHARTSLGTTAGRVFALAATVAICGGIALGAMMRAGSAPSSPSASGEPSPVAQVSPSPSAAPSSTSSASPSPTPASSASPTSSQPAATGAPPTRAPAPSPSIAGLPAEGSAEFGTYLIEMATTPDDRLVVAVPSGDDTTVVLLDPDGRPASGWPIELANASGCVIPGVAADGSIRLTCLVDLNPEPGGECVDVCAEQMAFAFDAAGRSRDGWPVTLHGGFEAGYQTELARVVGDRLIVPGTSYQGGTEDVAEQVRSYLTEVAADGSVRFGNAVPGYALIVGPDATGYTYDDLSTDLDGAPKTRITAFDMDGVRDGWPAVIDGLPSLPGFGKDGLLRLAVATRVGGPYRLVVVEPDGRTANLGPVPLPIVLTSGTTTEIESRLAPPFVTDDQVTYLVSRAGGDTTVLALGAGGDVLRSFPLSTGFPVPPAGKCEADETGCGTQWAEPAIGPNNMLYVPQGARSGKGGSLLGIDASSGTERPWTVELRRPGSEFWRVITSPHGMIFALAVEPEAGGGSSATVLAIDGGTEVHYAVTLLEPGS